MKAFRALRKFFRSCAKLTPETHGTRQKRKFAENFPAHNVSFRALKPTYRAIRRIIRRPSLAHRPPHPITTPQPNETARRIPIEN